MGILSSKLTDDPVVGALAEALRDASALIRSGKPAEADEVCNRAMIDLAYRAGAFDKAALAERARKREAMLEAYFTAPHPKGKLDLREVERHLLTTGSLAQAHAKRFVGRLDRLEELATAWASLSFPLPYELGKDDVLFGWRKDTRRVLVVVHEDTISVWMRGPEYGREPFRATATAGDLKRMVQIGQAVVKYLQSWAIDSVTSAP